MARILVVDDEMDTTELLALTLMGEGYTMVRANTGEQALKLAREQRPDLIVLDLMMPDMSGLEVCKSIRALRETAHIPILMLSALRDVDYQALAFNAGADDYLAKPAPFAELKSHIEVLLKRKAQPAPDMSRPRGKVIAVLGASGGVGASTAALNLAAVALETFPDTVMAELTPGTGSLAMQLGLRASQGLGSLLRLDRAQITDEVVRQALVQGPQGLSLLLSEQEARLAAEAKGLPAAPFEAIIESLGRAFRVVFLDLGHGYTPRAVAACALASQVALVARAEVASLQGAIQLMRLIGESGVPVERLHTILVAFHPAPRSIGPEQAREIFRQEQMRYNVLFGFPPMSELLWSAQEQGMPVISLAEGARLKSYLQQAVGKLLK